MLDDLKARLGNIEDPHQLFIHNLGAALTMENTVDTMLGKLIEAANGSELKQNLRQHREETQAQIRNLEQAFESLGAQRSQKPCPTIEALEKEGEMRLAMVSEDLTDSVILAGAAETEHHEIAVYENLIVHANAHGHEDVVALLQENLEQEQQTLGKVLKASLKEASKPKTASR
jgi:ferritin-like metal-binding protein YciE